MQNSITDQANFSLKIRADFFIFEAF